MRLPSIPARGLPVALLLLGLLAPAGLTSLGAAPVPHPDRPERLVETRDGLSVEPMFYSFRPVSPFAAHGYGPVLLAGAEMLTLRQGKGVAANINDGSMQFAPSPSRF